MMLYTCEMSRLVSFQYFFVHESDVAFMNDVDFVSAQFMRIGPTWIHFPSRVVFDGRRRKGFHLD